jgi:lambda repressor-like predicted transcriptional regulator
MSDWNSVKSSYRHRKAELDSKTDNNALEQKISKMNMIILMFKVYQNII